MWTRSAIDALLPKRLGRPVPARAEGTKRLPPTASKRASAALRPSSQMGGREVHPAPPALRLPEGLAAGKRTPDRLSPTAAGEPWAEGRHKRPAAAAVDGAGLDPAATFHSLHHAGITRMLKAGVPTQAVAGHHGTSARYAALGALALDPEHAAADVVRPRAEIA